MLHNQVNGNMILSSTGYDHISIFLRWQDKIVKCRLDKLCVLQINIAKIINDYFLRQCGIIIEQKMSVLRGHQTTRAA